MPRYKAKTDILLAHESRVVKAGEEFTTTFPKAKVDGKEVDMKLGDNIELLKDEKPSKAPAPAGSPAPSPAPAGQGASGLV